MCPHLEFDSDNKLIGKNHMGEREGRTRSEKLDCFLKAPNDISTSHFLQARG
jgi:hypothetical protein